MKSSLEPKAVRSTFLLILMGAAVLNGPSPVVADGTEPAAAQPAITAIRMEKGEVVISAQVPAGLKKVTLQSSQRLGTGAWEPRAVLRLDGQAGTVTFRVPRSIELEIVRVRADDSEPLPASFYRGTNVFAGVPLSTSTNVIVSFSSGPAEAGGGTGASAPTDAGKNAPPSRDVVESDIWKVAGDTLYFFNQYRGLQVVDLTNPDSPVIRGTLSLSAAGEQMYVLPDKSVVLLARESCGWTMASGSQVLIVNTADAAPGITASLPMSGQIQESRMVGTALYVMTQTYRPLASGKDGAWEWGTSLYAFDLTNVTAPVARPSLWYPGSGNVLSATDQYLFVSVLGDTSDSTIHCIDISAPDGSMRETSSIRVAGTINDKYKMSLSGDVFTAITEQWSSQLPNGGGRWRPVTKLETFSLADPAAPQKLGELTLADGEQLHATRFDGDRVYVVTFFQVDPLWVVDLSDPTHPAVKGEVQVPGWSTYIQPLGDRLLTIGIDNTNGWRVAVSLFDVKEPAHPTLLSKVPLGENSSWSEANYDEKAFGVFPEAGLVLVPFSTYSTTNVEGVQLIDLGTDSLAKRGFIAHDITPRRSTVYGQRILSVSGRELLTVDASNRDEPAVRSETELSWSVDKVFIQDNYLIQVESAFGYGMGTSPAVRVSPLGQPGQVLHSLALTNLPVTGATVRDGRLYLLQTLTTYYPPVILSPDKEPTTPGSNQTVLVCSVVDLSHLPDLNRISSADLTTEETIGGTAAPVWPKPDVLVWAVQPSYYWRNWYPVDVIGVGAADKGVATGPAGGGIGIWYPYAYGESRLLAVDVHDPASPRFVSNVSLVSTNGWSSFSTPYTADGAVFLSQQLTEVSITATNYFVYTNVVYDVVLVTNDTRFPSKLVETNYTVVTNEQPVFTTSQSTYLHVVDYSAPANPVLRKPITVPGSLSGLSRNGALLYFLGYELNASSTMDGAQWLHATAYDGVSCYLVDSHALPKDWPHSVLIHGPSVFITRPEIDKTSTRALETWTIPDSGKFTQLSERKLAGNAYSLYDVNDLLAVQEENGVELFDLTRPTELPLVGTGGPAGCVGWSLDQAEGSLQDGLWLPLGLYGTYQIPVKR